MFTVSRAYSTGIASALEKVAGQRQEARIRAALGRMGIEGFGAGSNPPSDLAAEGSSDLWRQLSANVRYPGGIRDTFSLDVTPPRYTYNGGVEELVGNPTMYPLKNRMADYRRSKGFAETLAHQRLADQQRRGSAITSDYGGAHSKMTAEILRGPGAHGTKPFAVFSQEYPHQFIPNQSADTMRGSYLARNPKKSYMRRAVEDERVVYNVPKGRSYEVTRPSDMAADAVTQQPGFGAGRVFYKGGPVTGGPDTPAWVSSSPSVAAGYAKPGGKTPGMLQWFNGRDLGNPSTHPHVAQDTQGQGASSVASLSRAGRAPVGDSPWYESVVPHSSLGTPGAERAARSTNRPLQGPASQAIGHAAVGPYGVHVLGGVDPFKPDGSVARSIRAQGTPRYLVEGGWVPQAAAVPPANPANHYLMADNPDSRAMSAAKAAPAVPGPAQMSLGRRLAGWLTKAFRRGR